MTNAPNQIWAWRFAPDDTPPQDDLYFARSRPELADLASDLTPYTLTRLYDAAIAERDELDFLLNEGGDDSVANLIRRAERAEDERNALQTQVDNLTEWDAAGRIERLVGENEALRAQIGTMKHALTCGLFFANGEASAEVFTRLAQNAMKGTPNAGTN
jgi:hypothetical protein